VDEVEIPWEFEQVVGTARRHFATIFGAEISSAAEAFGDQLNDYSHAWAEEARMHREDPRSYLTGLEGEQAMWEPLGRLFRRYRAIVCPTWAVTGIPAGDSFLGTIYDWGGPNDRQYRCFMTTPFNVLSPCPVLAVPSGTASNGVPTGVQVVARTYDDASAFRIGAALERVRPWPGVRREVPAWP
jgi:aspartyl-tRNA(Asn)/glutamyl-tRNA(Gln) amidotransferase subunit A